VGAFIATAVGAGLAAVPAAGASTLVPREPTLECHAGDGSRQVPNCGTVIHSPKPLGRGQERIVRVQCPTRKPYFWNWALRASPGVHGTLVREIEDARGRDVGAVVKLDEQSGSGLGESRLLLGCSTAAPKITGRMTHRGYHPVVQR
jgi:hypothetical protein